MDPRRQAGYRGGPRRRERGRGGVRGGRSARGGAAHAHRGPKFEHARIEYSDSGEDKSAKEGSYEDEQSEDLDDASEDTEEPKEAAKPYEALIKSLFEEQNVAHAKRRKLDHLTAPADKKSTDDVVQLEAKGQSENADFVDEAEQPPEEEDTEGALGNEENGTVDASDPFESHFADVDEPSVARRLKAIEAARWTTNKVATKGSRMVLNAPDTGDGSDGFAAPSPVSSPSELGLKQKLQQSMAGKRKFDPVEQFLGPYLFKYKDLLYCNRNTSTGKSVRRLVCLQALNHVFKTRDRIIKNNAKLSHRSEGSEELELRDQGFTRPKVLMILPTREACYRMIETMTSLCEPETQENRKRFEESYHDNEDHFSGEKPSDFKDLFAGNDDDLFRLGVKFTRKTIKFFAQFYQSDILLASPLGLRMAMGSEESEMVDHDFLSSIEIVIVDQADALLMQNWEHVEYIFEHLNLQPKDDHGCDFSRVRLWYLENQAKYFRQTLLFTQFNTPELAKLFRLHCRNWAGKARIEPEHRGVLQELGVKAKQTFSRFPCSSVESEPDARFAFFTKAIVPALAKQSGKDGLGTLVLIPSYLDFVRVRNYFATNSAAESVTFGTISEYASIPEASRARSHFFAGRHKVLLYTERAHHFRRYVLKGVKRVVMYGLPDNPVFYKEIVGANLARAEQDGVVETGLGSVKVVFSRYDVLKLERIVGSQRVGRMLRERGDTFAFV